MRAWLKKWYLKSQTRAITLLEFNTKRGTHVHVYLTWLGVFLWSAVIALVIFG